MKSDFEKWMANAKDFTPETVEIYAFAIDQISQHYSSETGDIYQMKDKRLLKKICTEYRKGGRFEYFGNMHRGLYRAAISAYVRYFEETASNDN